MYYVYMHCRKTVKSSKYWHLGLNPTPLIDQKCTYEKVPKNLGRALPPSFGQNPKEQQLFFVRPSLMELLSSSPSNTRQAHLHVGS